MKNSNVRESPIACDTLLVTYVESRGKIESPKTLTGMFHAMVAQ